MSHQPLTIAIDGPAASGKSTVGQQVAEQLGFLYFDTGVMYRAVTFLALQHKLDLSDEQAVGTLAQETLIEIEPPSVADGRQYTVRVADQDITWKIREHSVNTNVSQVAAQPAVRTALTEQQRRIGSRGRVVMVGRDIGTVVMPDAPLKIYLDASVEERARRRYKEVTERGPQVDFESLLATMRKRDHIDSTRATAPLRAAEDAHRIHTDDMSLQEVIEAIVKLANQDLAGLLGAY
ncbi:MAG: (d)CMP kinase [Ardenticatenaceae bacterium]